MLAVFVIRSSMGRFLTVLCIVQFVSHVLNLHSYIRDLYSPLSAFNNVYWGSAYISLFMLKLFNIVIALYLALVCSLEFHKRLPLFLLINCELPNWFLQLHECVGTALGAMGPENFLSLLPLNLGVPDLSESNLWLFPILKQYIVGARLNFFTESILPMATEMKRKSAMVKHLPDYSIWCF